MKTVFDFKKKKSAREKITMVTCYSYSMAAIVDKSEVDSVLVGDSLAMVVHGHNNTTSATLSMMELHTKAVSRGIANKFIISDLPFMSYRKSISETMHAVQSLVQAGANAVKLEGAEGNLSTIKHIVESGVPVMGHIGLTPQFYNALGGFAVQGKEEQAAKKLLEQAKQLENVGCFAIVLECIPSGLAEKITKVLAIPTIGIGAGVETDGQVLVLHDLLGLQTQFKPKFLKHYLKGEQSILNSLAHYVSDVKTLQYPDLAHTY